MTEKNVLDALDAIRNIVNDNETAHEKEDDLYYTFVTWCAQKAPEPYKSIATLVLQTKDIDFIRWYA